ncbi:hypothetical protein KGM_205258 [Danaus plexippus plexippus]|uniref:Uncharacterized protein n=1 Tax=Danaus plexippus plexippus TaxID=278856 RepID=A0A212FL54_DANPL|nr:hypothetical protein KGM_205258 [Danaus plexippus plexippus]
MLGKCDNDKTVGITVVSLGENKLKSLETDLTKFKNSSYVSYSNLKDQPYLGEQIIQEIQNRNNREKNVILVGLTEVTSYKSEECTAKDRADVLNIITSLCEGIPKPVKVFRKGKRNPDKYRSVKACFAEFGRAKQLLQTWIRTEDQAVCLQIPNYTHYYNYRADAGGGGASAYIHNNINIAYQSLNMSEEITIYGSK